MKLVISPAKSLDFTSDIPSTFSSKSCFLKEAEQLNNLLKEKSPAQLSDLMHLSNSLAELNYQRNQSWTLPFTAQNSRQAIYAFKGDVYKGLDAYTIPKEKLHTLQNTVRIISGLYGLLKPMDLIQPYRLEMGTKFPVAKQKNLYEYWRKKITKSLNQDLAEGEVLVNLASNEYFKAIDFKVLKASVVQIDFKEFKNGVLKTIAIHSKRARGLMTRYIVDHQINAVDDLKLFNAANYAYDSSLSSADKIVFTR